MWKAKAHRNVEGKRARKKTSTVDPRMSSLDLFHFLGSIVLANVKPAGGGKASRFEALSFPQL
jgi:hypothetical protein